MNSTIFDDDTVASRSSTKTPASSWVAKVRVISNITVVRRFARSKVGPLV
jgi:hypothetical protein